MNWRIEAQQLAKLAKKSETRIGGMGIRRLWKDISDVHALLKNFIMIWKF